jgi:hypothetical protein
MSTMTDLLDPSDTRARRGTTSSPAVERPLALVAAVAGLVSAATVLLGCMAVGLVGWFASDAGTHGDTRDAIRVGADAWLLGLGAHLQLAVGTTGAAAATVSAVPLGLTLLCAYVAYRLGDWAGATSVVEDARALLLGALVMSGTAGIVAVLTAVLAATDTAQPGLVRAFLGGFLVTFAGGGCGLVAGSRDVLDWRSAVPEWARAVGRGALAATLLLVAAAALLLTVSLLLNLGTAANVLARLHADVAGGLLATLLVAAVAPNAVLLSGSYLLGPGFAVGAGTVVSPSAVVLAPVPAFPLLAALPAPGTPPAWTSALLAVPVLCGAAAAVLMVRRHPVDGYQAGAGRGVGAGALGGLLTTVLIGLCGGSVGPGRMSEVGADLPATLLWAVVAMGIGGLVGGLATTWWARRR